MGDGLEFSEACARYFAEMTRDRKARWTRQTEKQYRASCRMFTELMCDAPLGSITRQHAARFLETIGRLRADYGKLGNANSLPLDKLLELHRGEPHLSNTTLNRHALALSGLFKWAIGAGLYETSNPFAGQRRNVGRSSRSRWQPFRIDELNQLFTHPLLQVSFKDRVTPKRHSPHTRAHVAARHRPLLWSSARRDLRFAR